MSDANPTRVGQDNGAGDVRALFMKLFTGEVLSAFDRACVMATRHRTRNITAGKSASFANTGKAKGRYHSPGTEITGQAIKGSETVITVDDLLIADVFIANIDEAMNHYEVRGEYSHQLGQALARTFDKQVLRKALAAARSSNKITGLPGGSTITLSAGYAAATDANKAIELADAIFASNQKLKEKDTGSEDAFALVSWADYFRLVRNKDLLDQRWGGRGSYADAKIEMVAGIPLVPCNHVPHQNDATSVVSGEIIDGGDVIHANHSIDSSKLQTLVLTPDAVGTVKLMDLAMESAYDIRRQGTLMVAKMAVGHGVLRPECAVEVAIP